MTTLDAITREEAELTDRLLANRGVLPAAESDRLDALLAQRRALLQRATLRRGEAVRFRRDGLTWEDGWQFITRTSEGRAVITDGSQSLVALVVDLWPLRPIRVRDPRGLAS
jgi:hypothetical protein